MDKFKLFVGHLFYPYGGYEDYEDSFDSLELAKDHVEKTYADDSFRWAHVVFQDKIILKGKLDSDWETMNQVWTWEI